MNSLENIIKNKFKCKLDKLSNLKEDEVKNLVKDVKYTSVDEKGNTFYLLASSGKSNINNNDILDLDNVRARIVSNIRDTIFIVSDLLLECACQSVYFGILKGIAQ